MTNQVEGASTFLLSLRAVVCAAEASWPLARLVACILNLRIYIQGHSAGYS
jgi:hypothetical protein